MTELPPSELEDKVPPDETPEYPLAKRLGILSCLCVEEDSDFYRCSFCNEMQPSGSHIVWVTLGICMNDPTWSIFEISRIGCIVDEYEGWCLDCCRLLTKRAKPNIFNTILKKIRRRFPKKESRCS